MRQDLKNVDIEALHSRISTMGPPSEISLRGLIRKAVPAITAARKDGKSWVEITQAFAEEGIPLSRGTLERYYRDEYKEEARLQDLRDRGWLPRKYTRKIRVATVEPEPEPAPVVAELTVEPAPAPTPELGWFGRLLAHFN
jgi:hypothetical protein